MNQDEIQERNKSICLFRQQGMPLEFIGQKYGLTRERVRQITDKAGIKPSVFSEFEASRQIGCSYMKLMKLRLTNQIAPQRFGGRWVYTTATIELVKQLLARKTYCKLCGDEVVPPDKVYCPKHSEEVFRYRYPYLSDEQKKRKHKATMAWMERNPEKRRISSRKAVAKYCSTHREEMKKRSKEHYAAHLEEERAKSREYYNAHIEQRRAIGRERYRLKKLASKGPP
jgi:hypothetical protein